jgi:DNA-binding Xre family transcriptional regulator
MINQNHLGSSLDDFLIEDGLLAEVNAIAIKRVLAWQVEQVMKEKKLSKTEMSKLMHTSRAALERLLNPENTSVTLKTMDKAAQAIGKQLKIDLIDADFASV